MKMKPILLPFLLGIIAGVVLVYLLAPQPTAFHWMPSAERQALAKTFDIAAERLENGEDRLIVDEWIRMNIAKQPTASDKKPQKRFNTEKLERNGQTLARVV